MEKEREGESRGEEEAFRKFFSGMDDSGDDTFSHMLLLLLAHTNKRTFSFIRSNFTQWNVNTFFPFVLPALDTTSLQPAICAVCRKPFLS